MSYVATVVEFRNGNARKSKFKRTSINLTTSVTVRETPLSIHNSDNGQKDFKGKDSGWGTKTSFLE